MLDYLIINFGSNERKFSHYKRRGLILPKYKKYQDIKKQCQYIKDQLEKENNIKKLIVIEFNDLKEEINKNIKNSNQKNPFTFPNCSKNEVDKIYEQVKNNYDKEEEPKATFLQKHLFKSILEHNEVKGEADITLLTALAKTYISYEIDQFLLLKLLIHKNSEAANKTIYEICKRHGHSTRTDLLKQLIDNIKLENNLNYDFIAKLVNLASVLEEYRPLSLYKKIEQLFIEFIKTDDYSVESLELFSKHFELMTDILDIDKSILYKKENKTLFTEYLKNFLLKDTSNNDNFTKNLQSLIDIQIYLSLDNSTDSTELNEMIFNYFAKNKLQDTQIFNYWVRFYFNNNSELQDKINKFIWDELLSPNLEKNKLDLEFFSGYLPNSADSFCLCYNNSNIADILSVLNFNVIYILY